VKGVIVYTTIFGASNRLPQAPAGADRCVCFVDAPYDDAKGWELVTEFPATNPRRRAWDLRCVPHELFSDYSRVVWTDASFTVTDLPRLLRDAGTAPIAALRHHHRRSPEQEGATLVKVGSANAEDIKRQLDGYRRERFTVSCVSISCVIVRDHSQAVQGFNQTWHAEINTHRGDNTQVSLDYSAWKHGLAIKALAGTRHENPYAVHDHLDHKRRRKPYDLERAS